MMVVTTVFLALIIIGALYYFLVRNIKWPLVSYSIMGIAGVVCLFEGSVHFGYVGVEILGIGSLIVWLHYKYWQKKNTSSVRTA